MVYLTIGCDNAIWTFLSCCMTTTICLVDTVSDNLTTALCSRIVSPMISVHWQKKINVTYLKKIYINKD